MSYSSSSSHKSPRRLIAAAKVLRPSNCATMTLSAISTSANAPWAWVTTPYSIRPWMNIGPRTSIGTISAR